MKKLIAAVLILAAGAAQPARAVECDTLGGSLNLCVPRFGTDGDQWGQAAIDAFTQINSYAASTATVVSATTTIAALSVSTAALRTSLNQVAVATTTLQTNINAKVAKAGDTMTGALLMNANTADELMELTNLNASGRGAQIVLATADNEALLIQGPGLDKNHVFYANGSSSHTAAEAGSVDIDLFPDQGDDQSDLWRIRAQDGGIFRIMNDAEAGDDTVIEARSSGNVYLAPNGGLVGVNTSAPCSTCTFNVHGGGISVSGITGGTSFALEISTGIKINAGGILWADGSLSTTASRGGSASGGHTIVTGTVSGASVGTIAGTLAQMPTMYFDSASMDCFNDTAANATICKVKGYQVIASTSSRWCSSIGVSVGNGLAVGITTVTLTTGNNSTMVCFSGTADTNNSGTSTRLGVMRDGAWMTGFSSTKGMSIAPDAENTAFCIKDTNVSAAQHSYVLMGSHDAGGTLTTSVPQAGSNNCAEFNVTELATGGVGYGSPASSFTAIAPDTALTQTSHGVCFAGSTVTITGSGACLGVNFSGSARGSSNESTALGYLINGQFYNGQSPSVGAVGSYTSSAGDQADRSFTRFVCGLSTGPVSACLTGTAGASTVVLAPTAHASAKGTAQFGIYELRNAAGTGDVSSNGNTNFTGISTFTGTTYLPTAPTAPIANAAYRQGLAKAYVVFTGTGTVTIQRSFNVSSITDNGTGDYTANFTTPWQSLYYSCPGNASGSSTGGTSVVIHTTRPTLTAYRFWTALYTDGPQDSDRVELTCHGDQ